MPTSILSFRRTAGVLASLFISLSAQAQTNPPAWQVARAIGQGSTNVGATAVDAAGNVYEAGSFSSASTTVGTFTLTSQGILDGYLAKYTPAGTVEWVRQLGSTGFDLALGVTLDAAGNVYVTGLHSGTIALGNNLSLSAGASTATFVIRYSPLGKPEWAQQSTASNNFSSSGSGIGTDATGHVFLAGRFSRSITLGTATLNTSAGSAGEGVYLARLDAATGVVQSAVTAYEYAAATVPGARLYRYPLLTVAAAGDLYLLNSFDQSITVGGTTLTSAGSNDALMARFTPQSTLTWVRQLGGLADDRVASAAADASGNLYVVGSIAGPALAGTTALPHVGALDGYLVKYNPQGSVEWARTIGGAGSDGWRGVALDRAGSPYLTGTFTTTAQVGVISLSSAGGSDVAVAAYTPQGVLRWTQVAGGPGIDFADYLGLDAGGNLHLLGRFANTCAFGPLTVTTNLPYEGFLARVASSVLATQPERPQPLSFFPNPAATVVQLPGLPAGTRVQILDALGRVQRETVTTAAASVSVRGLAPGLYVLRATDSQGRHLAGRVVVE